MGKDIAYHLWKFGLLPGKDFGYRIFREYPDHSCWISAVHGEEPHPFFGTAAAIYNVIDSRQNDPQSNVVEALRGMGYTDAADHYTHINYAMVALTPRCAVDLGYTLSEEDRARPYLEVSGRKGFGVKADDLLDKLIAAAKLEVDARHPETPEAERLDSAKAIAIGALRYFMLKVTRNTIIAFDFRDALSFEGETGPYVQYAAVRAANILRKAGVTAQQAIDALPSIDVARFFVGATPTGDKAAIGGRRPVVALAAAVPRHHRAGAGNHRRRTGHPRALCLSAGAGVLKLLPPQPRAQRSRRGPQNSAAGHRCRHPARARTSPRLARHPGSQRQCKSGQRRGNPASTAATRSSSDVG